MPSEQKCADRLREQAYKTLTPPIQTLEEELQDLGKLFADKILSLGFKLEALRHTELPAAESALDEYLREDLRKRDIEGEMLARFTHGLRTKETQEEILTSLLDSAMNCFPRLALFVVHGDMLKGWASRGFSDSTTDAISSDEFSQSDCQWLLEALRNGSRTESADLPDTDSLHHMREEASGFWQLYPLHVLNRPVAIMFAGEAEGFVGRPKALSVLMDCVALRLENIALKIIKTLGDAAPAISAVTSPFGAKSSFEDYSSSQTHAEMSSAVLNLNTTHPHKTPATEEYSRELYYKPDAFQPDQTTELKPYSQSPELVVGITAFDATEEPEQETIFEIIPEEEPAAYVTQQHASNSETETLDLSTERFAEQLVYEVNHDGEIPEFEATAEPARETTVEPASVTAEPDSYTPLRYKPNSDTEILNTAARRFAELLVYEIRHDNEDAIVAGRKNHDLYKRLRISMDRSREMYEKRAAPTVAISVDYLHDEFVRILGDGDAGVLGEDYPGPIFRSKSWTVTP